MTASATHLFRRTTTLAELNALSRDTAMVPLGIVFSEIGPDYLRATMPVDARTRQPLGILHGGISVLLAETLGSCGAACASPPGHRALGLDINANHLRSVTEGWVTGIARPVHTGRTTHVWQIELTDDKGRLTCVSRITMAILAPAAG